jgi:hypothetical protein
VNDLDRRGKLDRVARSAELAPGGENEPRPEPLARCAERIRDRRTDGRRHVALDAPGPGVQNLIGGNTRLAEELGQLTR